MKTDILILGAGIGGFETFRTLSNQLKRKGINKTITLIDKNNYFTFTPMLHEVASGSVIPFHVAIPLRELVHNTPHQFLKTRIVSIHPEKNQVVTDHDTIEYDYCVVALGSTTNFFDTPGAENHAFHIRDLENALALQKAILHKLESCHDDEVRISIVGGGYSGVEVAGQMCDFAAGDIRKLYPGKTVVVNILQSGEKLLPHLPEKAQNIACEKLKQKGVVIYTGARATKVTPTSISTKDEREIRSDITIWTTGFRNTGIDYVDEEHCERGLIPVTGHLCHKTFKNLYAIGDVALYYNPGQEVPVPQLGEVAHRQGKYVGRHIAASLEQMGEFSQPFIFKSHGALMPIGDWFGIGVFGKRVFSGRLMWWMRRTVYVLFVPGISRKLRIIFDWTLHTFGFRHVIHIDETPRSTK